MSEVTVLIVPGLRDHVAEHWQTLLAGRLPRVRVVEPMGRRTWTAPEGWRRLSAKRTRSRGPCSWSRTAEALSWRPTGQNRRSALFTVRCSLLRQTSSGLCPPATQRWTSCGPVAGCRCLAIGCLFGASSRRAATIPWASLSGWPSWPVTGAANWLTWAKSDTSIRHLATAIGQAPIL